MRTLLTGMAAVAAFTVGACGGNVVVDPATSTGGTTTTITLTTTSTPTTATVTTSSGACAASCDQAIDSSGLSPCDASALADFNALLSCACGSAGPCETECTANFCLHEAISAPCVSCVQAQCGGPYEACISH